MKLFLNNCMIEQTSDRCQRSKEKESEETLSDFKYFYPLFKDFHNKINIKKKVIKIFILNKRPYIYFFK